MFHLLYAFHSVFAVLRIYGHFFQHIIPPRPHLHGADFSRQYLPRFPNAIFAFAFPYQRYGYRTSGTEGAAFKPRMRPFWARKSLCFPPETENSKHRKWLAIHNFCTFFADAKIPQNACWWRCPQTPDFKFHIRKI